MWWSRSTLSIKSIPAMYCKSEKKLQGTVGAELFLGVRSPRGPINPKKYIGSWKWSTYGIKLVLKLFFVPVKGQSSKNVTFFDILVYGSLKI